MQYWKMNPHNELVSGSLEAYCLAEPGAQYMVYIPNGGIVKLNLEQAPGLFELKWLDPSTGNYSKSTTIDGEKDQSFILEDGLERVLILQKKVKRISLFWNSTLAINALCVESAA